MVDVLLSAYLAPKPSIYGWAVETQAVEGFKGFGG